MRRFLFPLLSMTACGGAVGLAMTTEDLGDKLATRFLKSADTILRQDPDDGRFGLNRLPTVHGRQYFDNRKPDEKAASDAWDELSKSYTMALVSLGKFDASGTPKRHSMMSGHYQLNYAPFVKDDSYFKAESEFHQQVAPDEAAKLYRSGKAQSRVKMNYAGNKAVIDFKAVFPSSEKCLSCHSEVPKGKAVGVLALIRVPK